MHLFLIKKANIGKYEKQNIQQLPNINVQNYKIDFGEHSLDENNSNEMLDNMINNQQDQLMEFNRNIDIQIIIKEKDLNELLLEQQILEQQEIILLERLNQVQNQTFLDMQNLEDTDQENVKNQNISRQVTIDYNSDMDISQQNEQKKKKIVKEYQDLLNFEKENLENQNASKQNQFQEQQSENLFKVQKIQNFPHKINGEYNIIKQSSQNFEENINKQNTQKLNKKSPQEFWQDILYLLDQQNYELAAKNTIEYGDDIWFLRLAAIFCQENNLKLLSTETAKQFLNHYMKIQESQFIEKMCINFYQEMLENGVAQNLPQGEQLAIIKTLEENKQQKGIVGKVIGQTCEKFQNLYTQNIKN
ncbi:hypothetical protein PPERSA_12091 [Pseudocohnilembus persalinus]|uniref:Uncharacterized protein n=1 Tax=Pseudocohnilembus persalinus TaxID=266149 RepID=A0A0V0R900_PSEPJ|nr:hypothetical protein PPERSA_12091 [Pseudocohnilembus persalinus]|eukprot:KRX10967.1 hypothetical protein PPERSA_12091 [Pseudocohnilembus persalinus]